MPKVLSKELSESAALVVLDFARGKYPQYTDTQLSSIFKSASAKVRKIHAPKVISTSETSEVESLQ